MRIQVKFWLRKDRPSESEVLEHIDKWRSNREMQPTIKRALQLWIDLSNGSTVVLNEHFPGTGALTEILHQQTAILEKLTDNRHTDLADVTIFAESVSIVDSSEVRLNFASGLGDLFADDDSDLFD